MMATRKPAAKKAPAKNKRVGAGRPSDYSLNLANAIAARIADGESLVSICKSEGMPHRITVLRWVDQHEEFRNIYTRAREAQADKLAEEIIAISDEQTTVVRGGEDEDTPVEVVFDATAVARNRLRVDARKWYAAKVAPKKYGEKLAVGGADDLPPVQSVHELSTEALMAIAAGKTPG